MTEKESTDVLLNYVEGGARLIIEDHKRSIDSYAEDCKRTLDAMLDSIKATAEGFDTLMPSNVIELLSSGGFIRSKNVEVEYDRMRLTVELGNMKILHDPYQRNELDKGFYRVTVIVEPLKKEAEP